MKSPRPTEEHVMKLAEYLILGFRIFGDEHEMEICPELSTAATALVVSWLDCQLDKEGRPREFDAMAVASHAMLNIFSNKFGPKKTQRKKNTSQDKELAELRKLAGLKPNA